MNKSSTLRYALLSLFVTCAVALGATLIALAVSSTASGTGEIGVVAGGISERFVTLLLVALPVIFLSVFLLLRSRHS